MNVGNCSDYIIVPSRHLLEFSERHKLVHCQQILIETNLRNGSENLCRVGHTVLKKSHPQHSGE
jgi:hypothetical protein